MKPHMPAHKYHPACNLQGAGRSGILGYQPRALLRARCLKSDGHRIPVVPDAQPLGPAEPPPFYTQPRFEDRAEASASDNPEFDDLVLDEALYRELGITPDELDEQKAGRGHPT